MPPAMMAPSIHDGSTKSVSCPASTTRVAARQASTAAPVPTSAVMVARRRLPGRAVRSMSIRSVLPATNIRKPELNITMQLLGNILNIWMNITPLVQIVTAPRNWQSVAEEIRTSVTCKPQRLSRTQLLRLAGAIPCSIVMEADGQRVPVQSIATNAMLVKTVNS